MSDIMMPPGGGRKNKDLFEEDLYDEDFEDDFFEEDAAANYSASTSEEYEQDMTSPLFSEKAASKNPRNGQRKPQGKTQKKRKQVGLEQQVKNLRGALAFTWIIFGGIILLLVIIVLNVMSSRYKGEHREYVYSLSENIPLAGNPDIAEQSDALFLKYLNRAYIVLGTYPDCELIKISDKVAKNEIDWTTDIHVNSKGLYYSYFEGEEDRGKVGIDVSEFQHTIDWEKVSAVGIDIAMIRVGYRGYGSGNMQEDSMYKTNIEGAKEAGLSVGVYFFSSAINRDEGVEEAQFVLDRIKDYSIDQPIVIDTEYVFEDDEARANNISVEDRTAAVVGFCETIEAAGYTPMIYASRDQFIKYLDIEAIGDWEFWLAAYDTPIFPYHTEGYQYTPYGYVDGIETQVDLDVWMR